MSITVNEFHNNYVTQQLLCWQRCRLNAKKFYRWLPGLMSNTSSACLIQFANETVFHYDSHTRLCSRENEKDFSRESRMNKALWMIE